MSKRAVLILTIAIAAGAIGTWVYLTTTTSASVDEKDLVTVERVDYPVIVTASGILEAAKSVSVGAPRIRNERRFKLARIVDEGKEVSEGDFLLEFDGSDISRRLRDETANFQRVQEEYQKKRSDFDIQLRDLKLQLEQAKSDYEKLENKLDRQADLESAIVIEETRIRRDMGQRRVALLEKKVELMTESGRLDLQISRSNENHYKSRMEDLMDAMDSLTVTAPVGGVVIYKRDWNNEPKQVGSFVFVLDTVLEIPDLSSLRAKILVDEVDAGKLKVGQEAQILVDAVQGRVFRGRITSVSAILKQASFDRPQKVAEVMLELDDPDTKGVRPGMSARALIQVGKHPEAIVIPLSSIQEREGRSFVQVWQPEKKSVEWREIQLLTNDAVSAVVESGLQVDEKIRLKPKA